MEHSPTSATGTGMGADAVARNAAGGVGGVREECRAVAVMHNRDLYRQEAA
jgi:hypothetical protein